MSVISALMLSLGVVVGGAVLAPSAGAQTCPGSVSTSVTSPTLPGETWSVTDGCLPTETFFEYADGGIRAQVGLSSVTYDDGHLGRVAAGILTLGDGQGLAVVGVEDAATGLIKWSAVLADYHEENGRRSVAGDGVTLFPTEGAQVDVALTGTGTDVTDLVNEQLAESATTTTVDPTATTVPGTAVTETTAPTSTTTPDDSASPTTTIAPSTTAPLAVTSTSTAPPSSTPTTLPSN